MNCLRSLPSALIKSGVQGSIELGFRSTTPRLRTQDCFSISLHELPQACSNKMLAVTTVGANLQHCLSLDIILVVELNTGQSLEM